MDWVSWRWKKRHSDILRFGGWQTLVILCQPLFALEFKNSLKLLSEINTVALGQK